ncbi:hypothetical protein, partial [Brevundimonas sp.]|uniref:hypothetical protein n=1 Tax=Brevundimonas sp. TaxID=1871086 RepID=UPI0028AE5682
RLIDPPLAHHRAVSGFNDQSESAPAVRGNCRLFQRYRSEAAKGMGPKSGRTQAQTAPMNDVFPAPSE